MASDLLNEQDLRTSTPWRWRSEQLMTSTVLVCSLPLELEQWAAVGNTLA